MHDDAKYECQVGPGRGNPPIRANAFLTVNCKLNDIKVLPLIQYNGPFCLLFPFCRKGLLRRVPLVLFLMFTGLDSN